MRCVCVFWGGVFVFRRRGVSWGCGFLLCFGCACCGWVFFGCMLVDWECLIMDCMLTNVWVFDQHVGVLTNSMCKQCNSYDQSRQSNMVQGQTLNIMVAKPQQHHNETPTQQPHPPTQQTPTQVIATQLLPMLTRHKGICSLLVQPPGSPTWHALVTAAASHTLSSCGMPPDVHRALLQHVALAAQGLSDASHAHEYTTQVLEGVGCW